MQCPIAETRRVRRHALVGVPIRPAIVRAPACGRSRRPARSRSATPRATPSCRTKQARSASDDPPGMSPQRPAGTLGRNRQIPHPGGVDHATPIATPDRTWTCIVWWMSWRFPSCQECLRLRWEALFGDPCHRDHLVGVGRPRCPRHRHRTGHRRSHRERSRDGSDRAGSRSPGPAGHGR